MLSTNLRYVAVCERQAVHTWAASSILVAQHKLSRPRWRLLHRAHCLPQRVDTAATAAVAGTFRCVAAVAAAEKTATAAPYGLVFSDLLKLDAKRRSVSCGARPWQLLPRSGLARRKMRV